MSDRKCLIVANPVSGGGKGGKIAERVANRFSDEGIVVEKQLTQPGRDAKKIVEESAQSAFSDLIVIGGDGTIHQAINGMSSSELVLSVIPAGTGNDYIKNIAIGKSFPQQVETALKGRIIEVDVGICNDRKFVNGVGVGFDGQIVYEMLHRKTWLKGHAAYYYHVLRILASYRERDFEVAVDGLPMNNRLILMTIGNGTTFGGGFKLTPNARIDDGFLDICTVGGLSAWKRFLNIGKLSNGTHLALPEINELRARAITIGENALLEAHIDGEYLGKPPFEINILPKALKVRINPS